MAEDRNLPETNDEVEGKKGSSKLVLVAILAVLLLGGAGGAAFFLISSSGKEKTLVEAGEQPAGKGGSSGAVAVAQFVDVPEMVVNLMGSTPGNHYLKLHVRLEVATEADAKKVQDVMPRVVDDFQVYLRQLRLEDLDASSGVYRLKEALLLRANQAAYPVEVSDVLFVEMLAQ